MIKALPESSDQHEGQWYHEYLLPGQTYRLERDPCWNLADFWESINYVGLRGVPERTEIALLLLNVYAGELEVIRCLIEEGQMKECILHVTEDYSRYLALNKGPLMKPEQAKQTQSCKFFENGPDNEIHEALDIMRQHYVKKEIKVQLKETGWTRLFSFQSLKQFYDGDQFTCRSSVHAFQVEGGLHFTMEDVFRMEKAGVDELSGEFVWFP